MKSSGRSTVLLTGSSDSSAACQSGVSQILLMKRSIASWGSALFRWNESAENDGPLGRYDFADERRPFGAPEDFGSPLKLIQQEMQTRHHDEVRYRVVNRDL